MRTNSSTTQVLLKIKCSLISLCLIVASMHSSTLYAQGEDIDIDVPNISQIQESIGVIGQAQKIIATVKDDRGVKSVTLFYRFGETADFASEPMLQVTTTRFEATALPKNKTAKTFQFYIEAADISGNTTFSGYAFSPKTRQLTTSSEGDAEQPSQGVAVTPVVPDPSRTQASEPSSTPDVKSGNRTLYTVLGVLAAVVVVGAASSLGSGGDDGTPAEAESGGTVTFTTTSPTR